MTSSNQETRSGIVERLEKPTQVGELSSKTGEDREWFFSKLPIDEAEFTRVETQHLVIRSTLGLILRVPDLAKSALLSGGKGTPTVVEFGTRWGHWAIDFATEFPDVSVVGVETATPDSRRLQAPHNCRFETYGLDELLNDHPNSFNICYLNCTLNGVKSEKDLAYQVPRILRPNGLLMKVDVEPRLFLADQTPCPMDIKEGEPGWCATQAIIEEHLRSKIQPEALEKWEQCLSTNPYLTSTGFGKEYIPIGPWRDGLDDRSTQVANLMQANA
ncbi:hypothetical protein FRC02_007112 [Tulasnella sp. 418]|nr:hypothetical protein FRC02_007112 [Tulasnella sp. 418]